MPPARRLALAMALLAVGCNGGATEEPVGAAHAVEAESVQPAQSSPEPEDRAGWPSALVELADRARERFGAPSRAADPRALGRADRAPILVDVREPRETDVSHVPGAVLLPDAASRAAFVVEQLGDRSAGRPGGPSGPGDVASRPVLVYCTAGWRSAEATLDFRAAGLEAYNLEGGVCAWGAAGGPLVDPAGRPTRRIHAYSADFADCVPATHEAVVGPLDPNPEPGADP